jgi:hypothetical protein
MLSEPCLIAHPVALFQVASCRKRLVANAGQDDSADAIASNQIRKDAEEVASGLRVDGIHGGRPIECDLKDLIRGLRNCKRFEDVAH